MLRGRPAAKKGEVVCLLLGATTSAVDRGLIPAKPTAAVDATGLEIRHASRYFAARSGGVQGNWAKLTVACDTASHFFVGVSATTGPSNDSPAFAPVVTLATLAVRYDRVLADAAFDAEENHRLARKDRSVRSTIIPINARGRAGTPRGKYRRQMARRFRPRPAGSRSRRVFGQRWQAESAFSRHKRRLGSALGGLSDESRRRECYLRVLTHDIMLLAATG